MPAAGTGNCRATETVTPWSASHRGSAPRADAGVGGFVGDVQLFVSLRFADRQQLCRGVRVGGVLLLQPFDGLRGTPPVPSAWAGGRAPGDRTSLIRSARRFRGRHHARWASARAASTYVGSLSVVSACSGVLVRDGLNGADCVRDGVSKNSVGPTMRRQKVYRLAAIQRVAVVLLVLDLAERRLFPDARRLVGLHRRPAELFDEQPAGRQRLVAESRQTAAGTAARGRAGDSPGRARKLGRHFRRLADRRLLVTIRRCIAFTSQPLSHELAPRASRAVPDAPAARPARRNLRPS